MKITLIEPAMIKEENLPERSIFRLQPLALGVLAGLTPSDIAVDLIDDRFENVDYDAPCDLVGISVKTFTARRAYQIAREFRKRKTPVILGGHHVSLASNEAAEFADSIFIGEAENLWETVLEDAHQKRLQPVYDGGHESKYPCNQFSRHIYRDKKYLPIASVETARGCPFNCKFCSVTTFFGHKFRRRDIDKVINEIRTLSQKNILFVDDNIVGDAESAKELFTALIPLKIRWISQASISMTRDLELMQLMKESGCAGVLVGIESISNENLREIRKGWNVSKQDLARSLQIARDYGLSILGSFLLGLDNDTSESLDATLDFAIQQKMFAVLFNMLVPLPGTDLYQQLDRENRLIFRHWWIDPDYSYGKAVFTPKHFSPDELERKRMDMYRSFYGGNSIVSRLFDFQANAQDPLHILMYLAMNLPGYKQAMSRYQKKLGGEK